METRITEMLGIEHPVFQAAMGGVTTPEMVAAVCNAGGLGCYAISNVSVDDYREDIRKIKDMIGNKPFACNISPLVPNMADYVKVWIEEKVPVWESAIRDPFSILGMKKPTDVYFIPKIGKVRHGMSLVKKGLADAVIAHGYEGGGHPGKVASTVFVPKAAAELGVPVVASGGFDGGRGLATALCLGAEAVEMGTRFATAAESGISPQGRAVYFRSDENEPIYDNRFDGVYCNVIEGKNKKGYKRWQWHPWSLPSAMLEAVKPAKPSMGELMGLARRMWKMKLSPIQWCVGMVDFNRGMQAPDAEDGLFWAGQVVGLVNEEMTCKQIVESTVADAERLLAELYQKYVEPNKRECEVVSVKAGESLREQEETA